MAKLIYKNWAPGPDARAVIRQAEAICADYAAQGYDLTLRQLYYQFVARDLLPNTQRSYDKLGSIINQARLAGLLDWDYIVDRTRNLQSLPHWNTPEDILAAVADQYRVDKWTTQPARIEVWVEKEALAGVIGQAADAEDVAWFSCRGYTSQSELWGAAQRLLRYINGGQAVTVLHLGDHDPSGIDMTRDIEDRLQLFIYTDYYRAHRGEFDEGQPVTYRAIEAKMREGCGGRAPLTVNRIALNMDQVTDYDPPPNPAKITDSRARAYIAEYGEESWELDALDPATLDALIRGEIDTARDNELWAARQTRETEHKAQLGALVKRWADVVAVLDGDDEDFGVCGYCGGDLALRDRHCTGCGRAAGEEDGDG